MNLRLTKVVLQILGVAAVITGAFLVYFPAGLVVGGSLVFWLAPVMIVEKPPQKGVEK